MLLFSSSFFKNFIGIQLTNGVVVVSGVQQSKSVIHLFISILFRFFSRIGYYTVLSFPVVYSRSLLPIYFIYVCMYTYILYMYVYIYVCICVYVSPNPLIYPSPHVSSLVNIILISTSFGSFSLFISSTVSFLLDSTYQ